MCLKLGRSSRFQDYDIDVETFTVSEDARKSPWDMAMLVHIDFARFQGQMYDGLYSAAGLAKSPEERLTIVDELSSKFDTRHSDFLEVRETILACTVVHFANPILRSIRVLLTAKTISIILSKYLSFYTILC